MFTGGTDAYDSDGRPDEFGDLFQIVAAIFREGVVAPNVTDGCLPSLERAIDRRDFFQKAEVGRVFFQFAAFVFIADADFDLVHLIQNVETGDGDVIETVQHGGIADGARVQPADAAGTACHGAEFMGDVSNVIADFIMEFRRERTFTDARAVGFDDAENIVKHSRSDSRADAGTAGNGVRAGDVRICAVVAIEHRGLRAFKEDVFAFADEFVYRVIRIFDVGTENVRIPEIIFQHCFIIETFHAVEFLQNHIFLRDIVAELFGKDVRVHEIADADADAIDFIGVARPDAVFRRADFHGAFAGFFRFVQAVVIGENDVGAGGNLQIFHGNALRFQVSHFFDETFGINHDAGADDADGAGVHDAARHEAERIGLAAGDDGVTGIVSALGTDDDIGFGRQIVYDFPFSFIAPLGADDHCCSHFIFPSVNRYNGL